jgi:restriction system protein
MIPDFQKVMYPLLQFLGDGNPRNLKECTKAMIEHFHLTPEEAIEKLQSGRQNIIDNRTGWAKFYLSKAGLVETVKKGVYRITADGKAMLDKDINYIGIKELRKIPAFIEFEASYKNADEEQESTQTPSSQEVSDQTPEEIMAGAYKQWLSQMADDVLERVLEQSPQFFEKLVKDLLVKMGYGEGVNTQYTSDEGIDAIINEDTLGLDVIHVQAKRWKKGNNVGRPVLQSFVGAMSGKKVQKGVFITTSSFTKEALDYEPSVKIAKIDGHQLALYMIKYNLGVSVTEAIYSIKRIDNDYFEE